MTAEKNWRPHFDADTMAAANTEPTISIGSFTYVGRLFSAVEWFAWNDRLQQLRTAIGEGTAKGVDILTFYHGFFRAIFPRGRLWSARRRGVPFWAPDVADALLEEPMGTIEEAFARFFVRQARANGVELQMPAVPSTTTSPSTSGTSSSDSTLEPTPAAAVTAGV